MERFTISLDGKLAEEFDAHIRAKGYLARSEAVRDILRKAIEDSRLEHGTAPFCVAALSYIYNHHERELAERLTALQHTYHDVCVSTTHIHLDHDNCMETVMLRGPTSAVRIFANHLIAERGVRHGALNLVPVDMDPEAKHEHHSGSPSAFHLHSKPKS
jgi:CopG family nickel-responsive transcriptional regulator